MATATASDIAQRENNHAVLEKFFAAVSAGDLDAMQSLATQDLLAEMPYSDPPRRFEDFADYRAYVEPALEVVKFRLDLGEVHACVDPDLLIAEYTSEGIAVPTGKPYRNVYIGVWRFRDGRICGIREYFNPAITAKAMTPD